MVDILLHVRLHEHDAAGRAQPAKQAPDEAGGASA